MTTQGPRPVASLRQRVSPWRSGRAGRPGGTKETREGAYT